MGVGGTGIARRRAAVALIAACAATLAAALAMSGGAAAQGNCLGAAVSIPGTPGNDVLAGTEGNDVIDAQGGDDVVDGAGGDDVICGGLGADLAQGGAGNDRIEGGTENDFLVGDSLAGSQSVSTGDDDVAGGAGRDVVVGDAMGGAGPAAGEGDDTLNGGDENDLMIGDAYSSSLAVGTGDDDMSSGPGADIVVGDAMVGTPTSLASGMQAAPSGGPVGAFGSGGDTMNTQTETDFLVGDAANFMRPSGGRRSDAGAFLDAASSYCGDRLARQILKAAFFGATDEEIADALEDVLLAEFEADMLVGDCLSMVSAANAGARDRLNGGTENDAGIGGSAGATTVTGTGADADAALGGKGNDLLIGDGAALDFTLLEAFFGIDLELEAETEQAEIDVLLRFLSGESVFLGAPWDGAVPSEVQPAEDILSEIDFVLVPARRGAAAVVKGGGADDLRGGQGRDGLVGGAKKDKCSGGSQKDAFAEEGADKCEKVTGAP